METSFKIIVAPFTPFDQELTLDLSRIAELAEWYRLNDLNGVFVAGTTGEGASLTTKERIALMQEWSKMRSTGLEVIAHVGHNSIAEAQEMAKACNNLNIDGISMVAPTYFKPTTPELLVASCKEIANCAPGTPFYYYHIPSITGVNFPMHKCIPFFKSIETFKGIKYTYEDLFDFGKCIDSDDNLDMFFGRDEILLAGLISGAKGAVGSFYNYFGKYMKSCIDAFLHNHIQEARIMQRWIRDFCSVYIAHGGDVAVGKTIMKITGIDCGPVRLPLVSKGYKEKDIKTDLEKINFSQKILTKNA
jgi:N-acetylneuraminate lyase